MITEVLRNLNGFENTFSRYSTGTTDSKIMNNLHAYHVSEVSLETDVSKEKHYKH